MPVQLRIIILLWLICTTFGSAAEELKREVHVIHATDLSNFKTWIIQSLSKLAFDDLEKHDILSGFKIVPHFVDTKVTNHDCDILFLTN